MHIETKRSILSFKVEPTNHVKQKYLKWTENFKILQKNEKIKNGGLFFFAVWAVVLVGRWLPRREQKEKEREREREVFANRFLISNPYFLYCSKSVPSMIFSHTPLLCFASITICNYFCHICNTLFLLLHSPEHYYATVLNPVSKQLCVEE